MLRHIGIAFWSFAAPLASARAIKFILIIAVIFLGGILLGTFAGFISKYDLESIRAFVLVPGIPAAAAILSEIALRDGIRQRTLLYALLGPVPRPILALVRTLATALVLVTGTTLIILFLHVLRQTAWGPLPREFLAILLGSTAYVAVFGVIHLIARRGMIISLALYFIFDQPIGMLPFSLRSCAPSFHLRVLTGLEDTYEIPVSIYLESGSTIHALLYLLIMTVIGVGLSTYVFSRKNLGELC